MQRFLDRFGLILLLNIFWIGFLDKITTTGIIKGLVVSVLIRYLSGYLFAGVYRFRVDPKFIPCFLIYLKNLVFRAFRAALRLIPVIFTGGGTPISFDMQIHTNDPLIFLLVANAVTLTPGTISVEAGQDNSLTVLSIHDDGAGGALLARELEEAYVRPFTPVLGLGGEPQ